MTVIERSVDDDFLLICCDGIFDVMTNEAVCEFVVNHLKVSRAQVALVLAAVAFSCLYFSNMMGCQYTTLFLQFCLRTTLHPHLHLFELILVWWCVHLLSSDDEDT